MGTDAPTGGSDREPARSTKSETAGAPDAAHSSGEPLWLQVWWGFVYTWWLWAIAAVLAGMVTWNAAPGFPIVQLELAGTETRAEQLVLGVSLDTIRSAIAWDFVFIALYALALFFGSLWASQYFVSGFGHNIGTVVAIGGLAAGVFDIVENVAMLGFLSDWGGWSFWIPLCTAAAGPKFALIAFAALYLLLGIVFFLSRKIILIWAEIKGWRKDTPDPLDLVTTGELWPWKGADNEGGLPYTKHEQPPVPPRRGIAFCSSGGGIRSATYSLGAYQAMAEAGVKPDYLIGVSGGAYIASARTIVNRFLSEEERQALPAYAQGAPETENLRNNGEYLAPTTLQKFAGVGRVLLGLMFSVLLVGSLLVMLGRPWGAVISTEPLYPIFQQPTGDVAAAGNDIEDAADALADLLDPVNTADAGTSADEAEQAASIVAGVYRVGGQLQDSGAELLSAGKSLDNESSATTTRVVGVSGEVADTAVDLGCDAQQTAEEAIPTDVEVACPSSNRPRDAESLLGRAEELARKAEALSAAAQQLGRPDIPFAGGWWPIITAFALGLLLGLSSIRKMATGINERRRQKLVQGLAWYMIGVGAFLLLTIVIMPFLFVQGWNWLVDQGQRLFGAVQAIGLGVVFAGVMRALTATRQSLLATIAGGVVAPLLALIALINIAFGGAQAGLGGNLTWVAVAAAIFFSLYAAADLNAWSLHPYYRRRLTSVFAVKRKGDTTVEPLPQAEQKLSVYFTASDPQCDNSPTGYPDVVVCAAANISDIGATPTGRESVSFTFSGNQIAAPNSGMGWIAASVAESRLNQKWQELFTLPSAVAISGAAFAPSMGKATRPAVRALMALANLRLGVWLPRLDLLADEGNNREFVDRPLAGYLFREIFGVHKLDAPFIYVTDGGHWENLGLVEALRRRCTEIYVFDAAGNPPDDFSTLGEAIAIARAEPGVEVDLDIDPLDIRPPTATNKSDGDDKNGKKGLKRKKEQPEPIISPTDHVIHSFTYRNPKLAREPHLLQDGRHAGRTVGREGVPGAEPDLPGALDPGPVLRSRPVRGVPGAGLPHRVEGDAVLQWSLAAGGQRSLFLAGDRTPRISDRWRIGPDRKRGQAGVVQRHCGSGKPPTAVHEELDELWGELVEDGRDESQVLPPVVPMLGIGRDEAFVLLGRRIGLDRRGETKEYASTGSVRQWLIERDPLRGLESAHHPAGP